MSPRRTAALTAVSLEHANGWPWYTHSGFVKVVRWSPPSSCDPGSARLGRRKSTYTANTREAAPQDDWTRAVWSRLCSAPCPRIGFCTLNFVEDRVSHNCFENIASCSILENQIKVMRLCRGDPGGRTGVPCNPQGCVRVAQCRSCFCLCPFEPPP